MKDLHDMFDLWMNYAFFTRVPVTKGPVHSADGERKHSINFQYKRAAVLYKAMHHEVIQYLELTVH